MLGWNEILAFFYNFLHLQITLECLESKSLMDSNSRLEILNSVNSIRQQTQNGTLLLDDDKYALKAKDMRNLTWSCELEAELAQAAYDFCYFQKPWSYPNITGGGTFFTTDTSLELSKEFALDSFNVTVLSFLSTTTMNPDDDFYYLETQLLHDKATKMACAHFNCPQKGETLPPVAEMTMFFCTFDKIVQENEIIYEAATPTK